MCASALCVFSVRQGSCSHFIAVFAAAAVGLVVFYQLPSARPWLPTVSLNRPPWQSLMGHVQCTIFFEITIFNFLNHLLKDFCFFCLMRYFCGLFCGFLKSWIGGSVLWYPSLGCEGRCSRRFVSPRAHYFFPLPAQAFFWNVENQSTNFSLASISFLHTADETDLKWWRGSQQMKRKIKGWETSPGSACHKWTSGRCGAGPDPGYETSGGPHRREVRGTASQRGASLVVSAQQHTCIVHQSHSQKPKECVRAQKNTHTTGWTVLFRIFQQFFSNPCARVLVIPQMVRKETSIFFC